MTGYVDRPEGGAGREMTLAEWVDRLPPLHRARGELERLQIENIQLKFACGYPMPAELEKHIIPINPFKCGVCDARRKNDD